MEQVENKMAEKKWYAIHAHAGQENKVKENLQKSIERDGLQDLIGEIVVPSEQVAEIKGGQRRVTTRKFFPGYVLVNMVLNEQTWFIVKNTPGVSGFISAGRTPVALEEAEVAGILEQAKGDQEKPKPKVPFQQGELVKIIEGPFSNFLGTVDEINPERGRVKVLVKIFERLTSVELEFWQVEKG
jgi:transcriptional antiterminator NusG